MVPLKQLAQRGQSWTSHVALQGPGCEGMTNRNTKISQVLCLMLRALPSSLLVPVDVPNEKTRAGAGALDGSMLLFENAWREPRCLSHTGILAASIL